ncbi:MAG TPA: methyltransferase domain-containing protein [Rhodocyclaceae bacterium]|nr:methyltransferase domain-containing protein [Rhodocyclaceae bacterium]HNA02959.1 methyltransferase domain-containing protein [Rhodocyclaceae bacterium]HNB78097.1 methyltransferase domain-containing protein [Rhodocyclaceae bacterium]HNC60548.1 methyltransferase domain-containing protein [Rhodocyclaceae bacterium]HNH13636.1 methyltransferase domain-containing protein [Rhodocyclaceae bacterium]
MPLKLAQGRADDSRFDIERNAVLRNASRAARGYDAAAVLAREVSRRMGERLDLVKIQPQRILDVGCGTGADLRLLAERYPQAHRVGCDFSSAMLREAGGELPWFKRLLPGGRAREAARVCGEASRLPFAERSMSMLWSNLMLHWLTDPLPALREMHRVLAIDGLLMFTAFGPDTLKELRRCFGQADDAPHVHRFIDMHDLGDALVGAGFAEPVMDMETLTLTYDSLDALLRDLRVSGGQCALAGRRRGLTGKQTWSRVRAAYELHRREGRLSATFEVVYGHAWKPAPRTAPDGRNIVRFDPKQRGRAL